MSGYLFGAAGVHAARSATAALNESYNASSKASDAQSKIQMLKYDVEKLLMITEALWGILKDEHGFDEEELIRRVQEIDLRDGVLDGKVKSSGPARCPDCDRPLIGKRPICLYCGTEIQRDLFER